MTNNEHCGNLSEYEIVHNPFLSSKSKARNTETLVISSMLQVSVTFFHVWR